MKAEQPKEVFLERFDTELENIAAMKEKGNWPFANTHARNLEHLTDQLDRYSTWEELTDSEKEDFFHWYLRRESNIDDLNKSFEIMPREDFFAHPLYQYNYLDVEKHMGREPGEPIYVVVGLSHTGLSTAQTVYQKVPG